MGIPVSARLRVGGAMSKLIDFLFGCSHARYTFPLRHERAEGQPEAASYTGTYVVCLDCGKEFAYDWTKMRRLA